jgi:multidrug efflux pump subunit AcrA (membrane-fusion protein)
MVANSRLSLLALGLALVTVAAVDIVEAAEVVDGTLVADVRGQISAEMTGERAQRVDQMNVRVGDRVKKGDVLARLSTLQLEGDRAIAERALEEARASVDVAKAVLARARLDYDRRGALRGSPSYNRAAFEDAEVDFRARKASSSVVRRKWPALTLKYASRRSRRHLTASWLPLRRMPVHRSRREHPTCSHSSISAR